jgi:Xaa-Pro aminopeptidase
MRNFLLVLLWLVGAELCAGIPPEELARRRAVVGEGLDSLSALVMRAAEIRMRSNDVNYRYRQESNFLYLTGIEKPNCYLVIAPCGIQEGDRTVRIVVFCDKKNSGEITIPDGLVLDNERFQEVLKSVASRVTTMYMSAPDIKFVNDWLNGKGVFLDRDVRKTFEQSHPNLKLKNAAQLLIRARGIKSAVELDQIRTAIRLTGDGLARAMSICKPGVYEYELQAAIEYEMIRRGASYPAFPSIVGSGENSLDYHYEHNRRCTAGGDLVVMDVGAEFAGYSADVTRTIPVSGRFTREQREVYDVVLRAQKAAIAVVRPGLPYGELDRRARRVIDSAGYGKFWGHGVSHHLGLDTHDAGNMDTLRTGMVITVEPGIYIRRNDTTVAAGYRGFGIRIEDDVLVTEDGYEVLSAAIPKEAKAVEALVGRKKKN